MGRSLKQVMEGLPATRREKIEARVTELIAEERSLQDVRKAMKKTQVEMAKKLGMTQDGVSRVEHRSDMLLSTLRQYIHGLGGELVVVAQFPGRPPLKIADFSAIQGEERRARRAKARRT